MARIMEHDWKSYRVHVLESLERIEDRQQIIFDKVGKLEVVAAKHGALWGGVTAILGFAINKLIT